jgi:peptide/nickel transport system substrate-binding protein
MSLGRRSLLAGLAAAGGVPPARADETPRRGGVLRVYHPAGPASMSLLEETAVLVVDPMQAAFNNLVVFDPRIPQNSERSIVAELATGWAWRDGGRQLDFTLRDGVTWHDGKPFTSADVVHTWNLLLGRGDDKLRVNPRAAWWANVEDVAGGGDGTVSFRLKQPQPSLLMLLASAGAPIYPAHVASRDMRTNPIGTGPFRFAGYKRGESIRFTRNPAYWMPERPFLDGIEWTIVPDRSTQVLSFAAGKFDMTFPAWVSMPLLKDLLAQAPDVQYQIAPTGNASNIVMNQTTAPFSDARLRRAVALTLDRSEFVRIITDGKGIIGGVMMPPPNGLWGMTPAMLDTIPFYDADMDKRRAAARQIMSSLGYGPDRHLVLQVVTRNQPEYRDPAIILIDQLRAIWIEATLDPVDTAVWDARMIRRNYALAFNWSGTTVDDPDISLFENYHCGSARNFAGYCDADMEKRFLAQSMETDPATRRRMVWDIDRQLQQDAVRPIVYHNVMATCWHRRVHGLTLAANSMFNGWRMEDVWLDG